MIFIILLEFKTIRKKKLIGYSLHSLKRSREIEIERERHAPISSLPAVLVSINGFTYGGW